MPKICTKFLPFLNKQFNNNYYIKFAHLFIYTNLMHVKTFELRKKIYFLRHHSINLEVALDTDLGHTNMMLYLCYWNNGVEDTVIAVFSNEQDAQKFVEIENDTRERASMYWYTTIELDKCVEVIRNYK